ncbi:MAG: NYN domain-containing protein [Gemmataceae bacterium]
MKTTRIGQSESEHALAVFIDFENLAHGFLGKRERFSIEKVLERLVEKGKIVVKKAYCDWSRFGPYTSPLHEAAIELIEIPKRSSTGKNSADIRLVVDAIDLAYSKDHIDTFVILSGDSDFSPLVSKLKELGKHVIGLGLASATSNLLRDNCDEFIYYDDLETRPVAAPALDDRIPEPKRKVFSLLLDSLLALRRENKEILHSSMIKETMKRKKPSFNEGYHGYATFSDLLLEAQKYGLVDISKGKQSGTLLVTRFKGEVNRPVGSPESTDSDSNSPDGERRRRGRSRGRGRGRGESIPPRENGGSPLRGRPIELEDDEVPLGLPSYRPTRAAEPKTDKLPRAVPSKPAPATPAAGTTAPVNKPASPAPAAAVPPPLPPAIPPQAPPRKPVPPRMDDDVFGAGID